MDLQIPGFSLANSNSFYRKASVHIITTPTTPNMNPEADPEEDEVGQQGGHWLTISNEVLWNMQCDLDHKRTVRMGGTNQANDTTGDADKRQCSLANGTPWWTHCKGITKKRWRESHNGMNQEVMNQKCGPSLQHRWQVQQLRYFNCVHLTFI